MANNHSIDPVNDLEPVSNPSFNINFSGNIIIEAKKKILEETKKYLVGYIIWIDRSKLSQRNTGAIAY